jgi:MtfA peptidase
MMNLFYALLAIPAAFWLFGYVRRFIRRRRGHTAPLPANAEAIITKALPPFQKMPVELQRQLIERVKIFLAEKRFESCGGLELTDAIRLTVAAQACLLLLNRDIGCYPHLETILVYPTAYVDHQKRMLSIDDHDSRVKLGESWQSGTVVLAWDHVVAGVTNYQDGHNVTFHEFAHQLDQEDGSADGAPELASASAYATWAKVFGREYAELLNNIKRGRRTVLDAYGTTNPAEFFAVATEAFFEKSAALKRKHPELYDELRAYYHVDPTEWI